MSGLGSGCMARSLSETLFKAWWQGSLAWHLAFYQCLNDQQYILVRKKRQSSPSPPFPHPSTSFPSFQDRGQGLLRQRRPTALPPAQAQEPHPDSTLLLAPCAF